MLRRSLTLMAVLALGAGIAGCSKPATNSNGQFKALSERVEKLEADNKKLTEIDQFIRPIMEQQKAAEEQKAASEPDPDARFAIDVTGNAVDGPATAAVTIIEAFDFA